MSFTGAEFVTPNHIDHRRNVMIDLTHDEPNYRTGQTRRPVTVRGPVSVRHTDQFKIPGFSQ